MIDLWKNDILFRIRIFPAAFELDVNIANFVYYGKTPLTKMVLLMVHVKEPRKYVH